MPKGGRALAGRQSTVKLGSTSAAVRVRVTVSIGIEIIISENAIEE
jgi:hypothetical protein